MYRFFVFSIGGILLFTLANLASRRSGTSLFWGRWITLSPYVGDTDTSWGMTMPFSVKRIRTGQPNTGASCGAGTPFSCMLRLDPHAAFPDTHARSLNTESISKNVPDRNPLTSDCAFMLTPDGWWAPRFEFDSNEEFGSVSLVGSPSRR